MALLTQFRPSCALSLQEFEVSVYDPDNNSSFFVILNYLSCTCCRAETLFSLGYWPMSPINPTYALPIYAMKKLFKVINLIIESTISLFFVLTLSNRDVKDHPLLMYIISSSFALYVPVEVSSDEELGVLGRHQATACPNLRYLQRASKCKPASSARMSSDEIKQNNNQQAGCAPTRTFKAGKTITGHNKKAEIFLESLVHAASMNFFGRIPYGKVRKLHPCRDVDSATASTTWFVAGKIKTWLLFLFPELQATFLGVGNFHVWAHAVWFRIVYALRRNHESDPWLGLSMSPANYWRNLGQRLVEINIQKFKDLATFLKTRAKLLQTKQLELQSQEALLRQSLRDVYADDRINQFYSHRDEFFQPTASPFKQEADEYKLLMLQRSNEGRAGTKGWTKLLRNKTAEMKKLDNEIEKWNTHTPMSHMPK
eukprot:g47474.t1